MDIITQEAGDLMVPLKQLAWCDTRWIFPSLETPKSYKNPAAA